MSSGSDRKDAGVNSTISSESTGSSAPKARYIPPHIRRRLDEEQQMKQASAAEVADIVASAGRSLSWADESSAPSPVKAAPKKKEPVTQMSSVPPPPPNPVTVKRRSRFQEANSSVSNSSPSNSAFAGRRRNPRVDESEEEIFGTSIESSGINFDKYEAIPVEVDGENTPEAIVDFDSCGLHDLVVSNVHRCKYTRPTPVQKHSIPIGMACRDLMACAQTGSGKTAAFLLPIISRMLNETEEDSTPPSYGSRSKAHPRCLVLAPTRELATQIFEESRKFAYSTGIRTVVCYGGTEYRTQFHELNRGCDILVACPGRLVDLIERGKVSLARINFLVLDEADRMLDMGFEPSIRQIIEEHDMPSVGLRQTLMFSATFPTEIQQLAEDFLADYIFLAVGRVGSTTDFITQRIEWVDENAKRDFVVSLLQNSPPGLTLIFVETKRGANFLERYLFDCGYMATSIHGDREQYERDEAIRSFKSGATPILVATDVAARGLDIPNVTHVINYDMPNDIDSYVHRIGRTGRAGKEGFATSFFNEKNRSAAKALLRLLEENKQNVPVWLPEFSNARNSGGSRGGRGRRGGGGGGGGGRGGRGGGGRGGYQGGSQNSGGFSGNSSQMNYGGGYSNSGWDSYNSSGWS